MCVAFDLPVKVPLSQPTSFLTFVLLILCPIALGESERAAAWRAQLLVGVKS